jgi:hypothetical protein
LVETTDVVREFGSDFEAFRGEVAMLDRHTESIRLSSVFVFVEIAMCCNERCYHLSRSSVADIDGSLVDPTSFGTDDKIEICYQWECAGQKFSA